jgi:energy-coupling factor transporter ATP-binding protein EcfA2
MSEWMEMTDPLSGIPCMNTSDSYGGDNMLDNALDFLYFSGKYQHWRNDQRRSVAETSPIDAGYGTLLRTHSGSISTRRPRIIAGGSRAESRSELWAGDGWMMRVKWVQHESTVTIHVIGTSGDIAEKVLADTLARLVITRIAPTDLEMRFRYAAASGSDVRHRTVQLASWEDIHTNYAAATRPTLDHLIKLTPENIHGRLILLHGPTGTGKTTFIRALARAWQDWCTPEYIMDPDHLFGSAPYMMSILVSGGRDNYGDDEDSDEQMWRLLILEDTGELLAGSAKEEMGQALSRLLNMTDGMPGQGLNLLVLITSNEDLRYFHPAITRPGRCLANIEVPQLPYYEAVDWIGGSQHLPEKGVPYTLAELIALREGQSITKGRADDQTGQFL